MILPKISNSSKINLRAKFSGIDSYSHCLDKKHFKSFPYEVDYHYNSRGFRDRECPDSLDELKQSIWCIGDSFTVGIGSAISHTWAQKLEAKLKKRCINVSLDGASNFWISRQANAILSYIQPQVVIIHWSYWHRTETKNSLNEYIQNHYSLDQLDEKTLTNNFLSNFDHVEKSKNTTVVIHSFIPFWNHPLKNLSYSWETLKGDNWPRHVPTTVNDYLHLDDYIKRELHNFGFSEENNINFLKIQEKLNESIYIPEFSVLDLARDGHHYDIKTANYFSNLLIDKLRSISSLTAI